MPLATTLPFIFWGVSRILVRTLGNDFWHRPYKRKWRPFLNWEESRGWARFSLMEEWLIQDQCRGGYWPHSTCSLQGPAFILQALGTPGIKKHVLYLNMFTLGELSFFKLLLSEDPEAEAHFWIWSWSHKGAPAWTRSRRGPGHRVPVLKLTQQLSKGCFCFWGCKLFMKHENCQQLTWT
jgi:hypothetical protein